MAKLQDLISKAVAEVKGDIQSGVKAGMEAASVATPVDTIVSKSVGKIGGIKPVGDEQERVAELGFIAKSIRKGALTSADLKELAIRAKAVGVTGDVAEIIPDGFTGLLLRDIQAELNVAKLFPMRMIKGGVAHDTIAMHGIKAYLTGEGLAGTDSSESYQSFVATTKKVLAKVQKSYEVVDDSMIDLAAEVRIGIVFAIAESIEDAVINGDIADTMDNGTDAAAPERVANGIRRHGLSKITVAAGGVDWAAADGGEVEFLKVVNEMQQAGGVYLDNRAVSRGHVVLVISQATYGRIRSFNSYKTLDKAGKVATLMGGSVHSIFDIPFVVTSALPLVDTVGVVHATGGLNILQSMFMLNIDTMRLSSNGSVISESDRDISSQVLIWTGSLRFGFASIYDSTEAAINTISSNQLNVVAAIDLDA